MVIQTIAEGFILGVLLVLVCAFGIRRGAVGMVHLYSPEVQERCVKLGLTTHERIRRSRLLFKVCCIPGYMAYVLVCAYAINGAREVAVRYGRDGGDLGGFGRNHGDIHSVEINAPSAAAACGSASAGMGGRRRKGRKGYVKEGNGISEEGNEQDVPRQGNIQAAEHRLD